MLTEIAAKLDAWIVARNLEYRADGFPLLRPCRIRLLGQTALLEAHVPLHLNVTNDVDVYADYEHEVRTEFERLLRAHGKELDPVGHEAWMPAETTYRELYGGEFVALSLAEPECILLSKACKAPERNRALIVEYLATGPSPRFLELAERYGVNLETFL